jgi:hypothetical protein
MRFVPGKRLVPAAISLAFVLAACGGSAHAGGHAQTGAVISQSSIAGASLGQQRSYYKRLFGRKPLEKIFNRYPHRALLPYLEWSDQRLAAFFGPAGSGAILIDTWNKAYRTAAGVGPCTPLARLKAVYGKRLRQVPWNPDAYTVGNHLLFRVDFGVGSARVFSVALYWGLTAQETGITPTNRHGIALPFAASVVESSVADVGGCA